MIALLINIRRLFGFALSLAQSSDRLEFSKVLKGIGGAGVLEVLEDNVGGIYRAVYSAKRSSLMRWYFSFIAFRKSKRGIATSKEDMDIIYARLKIAKSDYIRAVFLKINIGKME